MKLARPSWSRHILPIILSTLIAGSLIGFLARYTSRIPRFDQWETLGDFLRAIDRGVSIPAALFVHSARDNGHPFPFQHVADLATVYVFGGDQRAEQLGMIVLAALGGWLLARRLGRSLGPDRPNLAAWVLPAVMVMALSPSQMETWVGPVQFRVELLNLAVIAGLLSLPASEFRWWRIWAAVAWGFVATFSFATGLLFWVVALVPVGIPLLRRRWIPVAVWLVAAGVIVWGAFASGLVVYEPAVPTAASSLAPPPRLLGTLASVVWFAVTALGNSLGAAMKPLAPATMVVVPLLGVLGVVIASAAAWRVYWSALRDEMWAWLALVAYAEILALAVGWGRHAMGPFLPFSSRYITITWMFWPAVLALVLLALDPRASTGSRKTHGWGMRGRAWASWAVLVGFLVIGLGSMNTAFRRWTPTERDNKAAALELPDVCVGNSALISRMGSVTGVSQELPVLLKWGVFTLPESLLEAPESSPGISPMGAVESVSVERELAAPTAGPCLRVAGWAGARSGAEPAEQVLVAQDSVILKRAWVGDSRPHVGPDFDQDPHPAVGWVLYIDTRRLPRDAKDLQVYALFAASPIPRRIGSFVIPASIRTANP